MKISNSNSNKRVDNISAVYRARKQRIKIIQTEKIVNQLPNILKKWRDTGRFKIR